MLSAAAGNAPQSFSVILSHSQFPAVPLSRSSVVIQSRGFAGARPRRSQSFSGDLRCSQSFPISHSLVVQWSAIRSLQKRTVTKKPTRKTENDPQCGRGKAFFMGRSSNASGAQLSRSPVVPRSRCPAGARPSHSQSFSGILRHSQSIARLSVILNFSSSRSLEVSSFRYTSLNYHFKHMRCSAL